MTVASSINYCSTHWTWYWSDRECAQCAMAAKLRDLREQLAGVMAQLADHAAELGEWRARVQRLEAQAGELQRALASIQQVAHTHGVYHQVQP